MSLRLRRFILGPFVCLIAVLFIDTAAAQLPSGTNWALTFADEFNGASLDTFKWSNGHPWNPSSSDPSNVTVSGGVLNLNAVRVNSTTFTGAGVSTENPSYSQLFGMTYGYVEANMKMPSLPGSWPAFWMLESGWPPELDINEFPVFVNGGFSAYNYSDNIHYTNSSGSAASLGNGVHYAGVGNLTQGFHHYGIGWTPTSVTFYCDGNVQSTITDPTAIANLVKNGGGPMYLLLDNSGGGSWPGVPSESQWPDGAVSNLQVDWVRVWKDTSGTATSIAWSNKAANGVGSWTDGTAWSGGQVPQLGSQTAIFGANSVNNQTVNWNYSQTVGGLTFNSATSYTIGSASGSLMLSNFTSSGAGTVLIDATGASGSGANSLNCRLELYNNVTIQTSSKPLVIGGNIVGTGNLTIAAGPVILQGNSSYTGATIINGGELRLGVNQALPVATFVTLNGGALNLNGHSNSISRFIVNNAGMSQSNGALTVTTSADGALQIGGAANSSGSYTMSGGSLAVTSAPVDVGWYGSGVFNQTGGQVTTNNYLILGRQPGSTGVYNSTGGTVTNTGNFLGVGQQGSGTLNVGGSGVVVAGGAGLSVGGLYGGGGNGAVNLNSGGLIQTTAVTTGGGISTFTFNGGTLQAAPGASVGFFAPLTNVVAGPGGAVIDTNGNSIAFASALSGNGGFTKIGSGSLIFSGGKSYSGSTTVGAGMLNFSVSSVSNIGAGAVATVASGATLELAGTVSALGSAGGNRTSILNNSTALGLVISGKNQVVGNIDGTGTTQINSGSDLTANHIVQSALVIGGAAGSPGVVTIEASDPTGNPLVSELTALLPGNSVGSFIEDPSPVARLAASSGVENIDKSMTGLAAAVPQGPSASAVPEPSTFLLSLMGFIAALRSFGRRFRGDRCLPFSVAMG
jgi:autotransporter-associated beta strand protein